MGAVATEAGVATGTAYVHYASKAELVFATYLEVKGQLGDAVLSGLDTTRKPSDQWRQILTAAYRFLVDEPACARFLTQLEESPYYQEAHARLVASGDPLGELARSDAFADVVIDLPPPVIYSLSLGVAVRLVAAGIRLQDQEIDRLVEATWRAVTKPSST